MPLHASAAQAAAPRTSNVTMQPRNLMAREYIERGACWRDLHGPHAHRLLIRALARLTEHIRCLYSAPTMGGYDMMTSRLLVVGAGILLASALHSGAARAQAGSPMQGPP